MTKRKEEDMVIIRQLIKEVKDEIKNKKTLIESKEVSKKDNTVKEYVTKNVLKIIAESE